MMIALQPLATSSIVARESRLSAQRAEDMYVLARTLLVDKSVRDISSVPRLLEQSAEAGFIPARLLLLDVWEGKFRGLAAERDKAYTLADEMSRVELPPDASHEAKAAKIEAMQRLAGYLEDSAFITGAQRQAFHWMREAAKLNSHRARAELARYYFKGIGCTPNPIEAIKLLKALTKEAPTTENIYFYLGYICQRGLGLSKPMYNKAAQYYQQGMQLGDARATNNLATLYAKGLGVEKDEQQALLYYRRAATMGDKTAANNMRKLLIKLGQQEEDIARLNYAQRFSHALKHVLRYLPDINPWR